MARLGAIIQQRRPAAASHKTESSPEEDLDRGSRYDAFGSGGPDAIQQSFGNPVGQNVGEGMRQTQLRWKFALLDLPRQPGCGVARNREPPAAATPSLSQPDWRRGRQGGPARWRAGGGRARDRGGGGGNWQGGGGRGRRSGRPRRRRNGAVPFHAHDPMDDRESLGKQGVQVGNALRDAGPVQHILGPPIHSARYHAEQ